MASSRLEDTCVATHTILEPRSKVIEEFRYRIFGAELGDGATAGMQVTFLCDGDQLIRQALDLFGFGIRGGDSLLDDERAEDIP